MAQQRSEMASPAPLTDGEQKLREALIARVKIQHLRVFVEVARRESVSKAAEALNLAQPAVTKTLRDFETLMGTEFFERRARGVVLKAAGELILPHVQAIFADLNRVGDELASFKRGGSGVITVGATMSALPYLLPGCLADPELRGCGGLVRVVEGTIDQMQRALDRGDLDLVVGRVPPHQPGTVIRQEILFEDPFVPVVGAGHPLARMQLDDLASLSRYEWVMPPFGSSATEPLKHYLARHGIEPRQRRVETVSYQVLTALLERLDCVGILPQHLARSAAAQGLLAVIGPPISEGGLPIGITARSDRPLHPLAVILADAFRRAARSVDPGSAAP